jgi:hypothetical protein
MELKRLAIGAAIISTLAVGPVTGAFAASGTPTPVPARETAVAARQAGDVAARRQREDARINGRIDLLNKLIARLQNDQKLDAGDKSLLLSEDQAAVSGLTALKSKIDADTTIAELSADAQQIASYHVRDVLAPQNRELIMVDNLQAMSTKIQTSIADLQTKVSALQAKGVNVSAIQALLNDATSKVTAANTMLLADEKTLAAITPSTTNASGTFSQVRSDLKTAREDFGGVRDDVKQIRDVAKQAVSTTPAAGATATPTP